MPLLEKIVEHINTTIKSSLSTAVLQKNLLLGIADKCLDDTPEENGAVAIRPFVIDNNGDGKAVEYNNGQNITAYHRILSNLYADDPQMNHGGVTSKICSTEMILVVSADKKKVKQSAIELEALIESVFPQSVTRSLMQQVKLYKCNITLLGSSFDQLQVFAGEYSNVPFFIKPQQAYFSIRYRIQSSFRPGCFQDCCNE